MWTIELYYIIIHASKTTRRTTPNTSVGQIGRSVVLRYSYMYIYEYNYTTTRIYWEYYCFTIYETILYGCAALALSIRGLQSLCNPPLALCAILRSTLTARAFMPKPNCRE